MHSACRFRSRANRGSNAETEPGDDPDEVEKRDFPSLAAKMTLKRNLMLLTMSSYHYFIFNMMIQILHNVERFLNALRCSY